jgi:hypothetical protein
MLIDERSADSTLTKRSEELNFINAKITFVERSPVTAVLVDLSKTTNEVRFGHIYLS